MASPCRTFAPETLATIRTLLPPMTYMRNPVDTARPGASFGNVLAAVAADPGVDAVSVYLLREAGIDIAGLIGTAKAACGKPLIVGSGGFADDLARDFAALRAPRRAGLCQPGARREGDARAGGGCARPATPCAAGCAT